MERYSADEVADAALWLWQNRRAATSQWINDCSPSNIVNSQAMAYGHDERQAKTPTAIIARMSEGDSGNHYSEAEHFVAEHLMQVGAQILDDDASVYGVTLAHVVRLLKDYKAPAFSEPDTRLADAERRNAELVECAAELADLVEASLDGDYKPDSFTTQPIRNALAALNKSEEANP